MIIDVTSGDAGLYICSLMKNSSDASESYQEKIHAYVRVRTRPGDKNKHVHKCLRHAWTLLQNYKNFGHQ